MNKIISLRNLPELSKSIRNNKIVLTTGVFDLFHTAHQEFLKLAKKQGDVLLVGVESDQRVKELKGDDRPIHDFAQRMNNVASLSFVDHVFALPYPFHLHEHHKQLIAQIPPKVFAVSSHSPNKQSKIEIVENYGGKVVTVMKKDPNISTSQILTP